MKSRSAQLVAGVGVAVTIACAERDLLGCARRFQTRGKPAWAVRWAAYPGHPGGLRQLTPVFGDPAKSTLAASGGSSSSAGLGRSERRGHICFGRQWCLGMASDDGGLCHETNCSRQQDKGVSVAGRKEQLERVLAWKLGGRSGGCSSRRRFSASCPRGRVRTARPL